MIEPEVMDNEIEIFELNNRAKGYINQRRFIEEDMIQYLINDCLKKRYFFKIFGFQLPSIETHILGVYIPL